MSWVKEALQGGDEERRKAVEQQEAEELARQRKAWEEAQAKANAKIQAEMEKREELTYLKRLLDERGARDLLRDIQSTLGGDLIFQDSNSEKIVEAYVDNWAAYELIKVDFGPTTFRESGGYEDTYPSVSQGDTPITRSRGYLPYRRYKETPVTLTKAVVVAQHIFYRNTPKPITLSAFLSTRRDSIKVFDIYTRGGEWGEIPSLLRAFPSIPGLISQRVQSDLPLLPNGQINIHSIGLYPGGEGIGISEDKQQDNLRLKQLLVRDLKALGRQPTS